MLSQNSVNKKPLEVLNIFSVKGIQMQTFHLTWLTFFFCFFGWFGIAPLMKIVKEDLGLTKGQIGNIIIASVSATIFARLIIGRLCDTLGPRLTYTGLLVLGSLYRDWETDRKSTRLNSSHLKLSRMPSSA